MMATYRASACDAERISNAGYGDVLVHAGTCAGFKSNRLFRLDSAALIGIELEQEHCRSQRIARACDGVNRLSMPLRHRGTICWR